MSRYNIDLTKVDINLSWSYSRCLQVYGWEHRETISERIKNTHILTYINPEHIDTYLSKIKLDYEEYLVDRYKLIE